MDKVGELEMGLLWVSEQKWRENWGLVGRLEFGGWEQLFGSRNYA